MTFKAYTKEFAWISWYRVWFPIFSYSELSPLLWDTASTSSRWNRAKSCKNSKGILWMNRRASTIINLSNSSIMGRVKFLLFLIYPLISVWFLCAGQKEGKGKYKNKYSFVCATRGFIKRRYFLANLIAMSTSSLWFIWVIDCNFHYANWSRTKRFVTQSRFANMWHENTVARNCTTAKGNRVSIETEIANLSLFN